MLSKLSAFKFSLDPLIKKNSWELEMLEMEVSQLIQVIAQTERELDVLEDAIKATHHEILLLSNGNRFDLDRHRILSLFLNHQQSSREPFIAEIAQATQLRDQAAAQLMKAWQGLEGLKKLKDKCKNEHSVAALRTQFKEEDDQWIMSFSGSSR